MALRYPLVDRGGGSAAAGDAEVVIQTGDIAVWSVPGSAAIVNAANQAMLGGGGVDGAIHAAAGPDLKKHCEAIPETRNSKKKKARCFTGEAVITPGFNLAVPFIIHTVGPNYTSMPPEAAGRLLESAYRNVLNLARDKSITHIAFPAISCGSYGFPAQRAAEIALSACMENSGGLTEIHFVLNDPLLFSAWVMAAEKLIPLASAAVVDDATGPSLASVNVVEGEASRKNTSADQTAVQKDKAADRRAFQDKAAASSPNPDVSDKRKGKRKGKILLLRYLYSEIEREFHVLPEEQGKTLRDVISSQGFFDQLTRELGPDSGIGENVDLDYEPIPFINDPQISVVEFVEVGGRILIKPDAQSQNDGRMFKQALRLQLLLNSTDYMEYMAKKIAEGETKPTLQAEEQKPRLKLDSPHDAQGPEKNVLDMVADLNAKFLTVEEDLKLQILDLQVNDIDVQVKLVALEGKVDAQGLENRRLRKQIQTLHDFARPFRTVIIRKLLDQFRMKATTQCEEAGLQVPWDWNEVAEGTSESGIACAKLVNLHPRALRLSRFGQGSLQAQAGASLHDITDTLDTWSHSVYATYVTAALPNLRSGLSEIYRFVFSSNAEDDAWEYVDEVNAATAWDETGTEGNVETGTEGNIETGTEGNVETGTEGNIETGTEGNVETGTEGNIETGTEGNIETGTEGNVAGADAADLGTGQEPGEHE